MSCNRENNIEDWHILLVVRQAKEIIYEAHLKHGSKIKVEPTYNKILKRGYR